MIPPRLESADPDARSAYRADLRRRRLPWTAAMLLVSWPIPLLSGLLLFRLGDLLGRWAAITLLVLWLLSGLPLLRPIRPLVGTGNPSLSRAPTPEEAAALDPAWSDTLGALGIDESTYHLQIRDNLAAYGVAHPSGTVVVSAKAVRELSPEELRGVLGHEIGHLIGDGGSLPYRLSWRYSRPATLPYRIAYHSARRVSGSLWLRGIVITVVQLGSLIGLTYCFGQTAAIGFVVGALGQQLGQRAILRRNQSNADRVSVDLGHGAGLASHLSRGVEPHYVPIQMHTPAIWLVYCTLQLVDQDPALGKRIGDIDDRLHARQESSGYPGPPR